MPPSDPDQPVALTRAARLAAEVTGLNGVSTDSRPQASAPSVDPQAPACPPAKPPASSRRWLAPLLAQAALQAYGDVFREDEGHVAAGAFGEIGEAVVHQGLHWRRPGAGWGRE